MITAFAGPRSGQALLDGPGWRWGFGAFTIILPVVVAPMYALLHWNLRKARRQGLLVRERINRSAFEKVTWGITEFDGRSPLCLVYRSVYLLDDGYT